MPRLVRCPIFYARAQSRPELPAGPIRISSPKPRAPSLVRRAKGCDADGRLLWRYCSCRGKRSLTVRVARARRNARFLELKAESANMKTSGRFGGASSDCLSQICRSNAAMTIIIETSDGERMVRRDCLCGSDTQLPDKVVLRETAILICTSLAQKEWSACRISSRGLAKHC